MSSGRLEGGAVGSTEIGLYPGVLQPGDHEGDAKVSLDWQKKDRSGDVMRLKRRYTTHTQKTRTWERRRKKE
jgi:hypothetical protein